MKKKSLLIVGLLIAVILMFATTFSFATDDHGAMNGVNDAVNGVRNTIGGAENAVEGAVKDVTDTTKNATDNTTNMGINRNDTQSTNYTANRTATNGTATNANVGTFLGMSSTMWTWLILAIAIVAIIALVWYYSNQLTRTRNYDDNDQ